MIYNVNDRVWVKLIKSNIKSDKLAIQLLFNRLRLGVRNGTMTEEQVALEMYSFFSKYEGAYSNDLNLMVNSI